MKELNHRAVVKLLDVVVAEKKLFLVFEHLDKVQFRDKLHNSININVFKVSSLFKKGFEEVVGRQQQGAEGSGRQWWRTPPRPGEVLP